MMIKLYQTQANTHLHSSYDTTLNIEDNNQELAANNTNNAIKNLTVNNISKVFKNSDNIFNIKTINKTISNNNLLSLEQKQEIKELLNKTEVKLARIYNQRNDNSKEFRQLAEHIRRQIL